MFLSLLVIQSLGLFIGLTSATTVQAWNGDLCDGSAGSVVSIPTHGKCINAPGRHSFEADGDNTKGYYYSASNCQGASTAFRATNGKCRNINTGGPVGSFCIVGASNSGCGYS